MLHLAATRYLLSLLLSPVPLGCVCHLFLLSTARQAARHPEVRFGYSRLPAFGIRIMVRIVLYDATLLTRPTILNPHAPVAALRSPYPLIWSKSCEADVLLLGLRSFSRLRRRLDSPNGSAQRLRNQTEGLTSRGTLVTPISTSPPRTMRLRCATPWHQPCPTVGLYSARVPPRRVGGRATIVSCTSNSGT